MCTRCQSAPLTSASLKGELISGLTSPDRPSSVRRVPAYCLQGGGGEATCSFLFSSFSPALLTCAVEHAYTPPRPMNTACRTAEAAAVGTGAARLVAAHALAPEELLHPGGQVGLDLGAGGVEQVVQLPRVGVKVEELVKVRRARVVPVVRGDEFRVPGTSTRRGGGRRGGGRRRRK